MNKTTKEKYFALVEKLDSKKLGIFVSILFFISLLPIIYVGLHNYASGDDYWYGVKTYRGLVEEGVIGALKGSLATVEDFYENWQGTWFTIFLFTLSPNHFAEHGYYITVFISLGLLIASVSYLAHFYLVEKLNFTKGATATIVCMILYLMIQYMPRTTSGIYWFNGVMHYSVPLLLGVLAIVHTHKFVDKKCKKDYIILFLSFTLLGGGSYLAPLSATLAAVLILICQVKVQTVDDNKQNKESNKYIKRLKISKCFVVYDFRNLWIIVAFFTELIGLAISFLSPGNSVRGGEEFGFSIKWALQCIYYAIDRGIYLGEDYFLKNAVTMVVFVLISVLLWSQLWRVDDEKIKFRYPLLMVIYLNGIYWASYTPEIYSNSDVSGGVPNTYMQFFYMITVGCMICVHGWLQQCLRKYWKKKELVTGKKYDELEEQSIFSYKKYKSYIMIPTMVVVGIVLVLVGNISEIRTTNDYCIEYISSGKMEQYVQVREEQHRILSDENVQDVLIPEVGDQYPLLHMGLELEPYCDRNIDRALYYNKKSVSTYRVD